MFIHSYRTPSVMNDKSVFSFSVFKLVFEWGIHYYKFMAELANGACRVVHGAPMCAAIRCLQSAQYYGTIFVIQENALVLAI